MKFFQPTVRHDAHRKRQTTGGATMRRNFDRVVATRNLRWMTAAMTDERMNVQITSSWGKRWPLPWAGWWGALNSDLHTGTWLSFLTASESATTFIMNDNNNVLHFLRALNTKRSKRSWPHAFTHIILHNAHIHKITILNLTQKHTRHPYTRLRILKTKVPCTLPTTISHITFCQHWTWGRNNHTDQHWI
jgi:hypothetical protein